MDKTIWQLKLSSKNLESQSRKAKRGELQDVEKMKRALKSGEIEKARLYATSATRRKNESTEALNMSLRLQAAISGLQSVQMNKDVARKLDLVNREMQKAMKDMNLTKVHSVLENFESQMEDSDVKAKYLGTTLGGMVLKEAPAEQVEELLSKAAEEHGLEIKNLLPQPVMSSMVKPVGSSSQDDITERLMKLRNQT